MWLLQFAPTGLVAVELPAHAHESGFGSGWEYDRGRQEQGGRCIAIDLPENAYFPETSYGPNWQCRRGFDRKGRTCAKIQVPARA